MLMQKNCVMKKIIKLVFMVYLCFSLGINSYAYSARHHLIRTGKGLAGIIVEPLKGIFIQGPQNIKKAYQYEVWEREDPEKRGQNRYRLFALWRAPGEEIKGAVDGLVRGVSSAGDAVKNLLSIIFSD